MFCSPKLGFRDVMGLDHTWLCSFNDLSEVCGKGAVREFCCWGASKPLRAECPSSACIVIKTESRTLLNWLESEQAVMVRVKRCQKLLHLSNFLVTVSPLEDPRALCNLSLFKRNLYWCHNHEFAGGFRNFGFKNLCPFGCPSCTLVP